MFWILCELYKSEEFLCWVAGFPTFLQKIHFFNCFPFSCLPLSSHDHSHERMDCPFLCIKSHISMHNIIIAVTMVTRHMQSSELLPSLNAILVNENA